jgi:hypothetical protein
MTSSNLLDFYILIQVYSTQTLHTQFLKFSPPPFFMALQVFKEKSKKMTRKDGKNLCFSTDFQLFYHFGKLRKINFQKINRLIVSSINRFFVNFSSIFMVLARKDC